MNTGKYVGFYEIWFTVINCKPRNDMLGNVPELTTFNKALSWVLSLCLHSAFGF